MLCRTSKYSNKHNESNHGLFVNKWHVGLCIYLFVCCLSFYFFHWPPLDCLSYWCLTPPPYLTYTQCITSIEGKFRPSQILHVLLFMFVLEWNWMLYCVSCRDIVIRISERALRRTNTKSRSQIWLDDEMCFKLPPWLSLLWQVAKLHHSFIIQSRRQPNVERPTNHNWEFDSVLLQIYHSFSIISVRL